MARGDCAAALPIIEGLEPRMLLSGGVTANPMTVATAEDQHLFEQVTGADSGGDFVTFQLVQGPEHGSLNLDSFGFFGYLPSADWNGTDSFLFRAANGSDDQSAPAEVTIEVAPANDAPLATPGLADVDEDASVNVTLAGTDVETAQADLIYVITAAPTHGSVTLAGRIATYTPDPDYAGPDSFGFVVTDTGDPAGVGDSPALTSGQATISITVRQVNDAPVAIGQTFTAPYDYHGEPLDITLGGSDLETPASDLAFQIASQPAHGTVTIAGNVATYMPGFISDSDWLGGGDSFSFIAIDNGVPAGSGTDVLSSGPAVVNVDMPRYAYFWQGHDAAIAYADSEVVCRLRGPGEGVAYSSQTDPLLIDHIIVTGTTAASVLDVGVARPLFYKVGDIEVRGPIKAINAEGLFVAGDVRVQGWAGAINLGDTFGGGGPYQVFIGGAGRPVTISLGRVADVAVDSAADIRTLKAISWHDDDDLPDVVTAPAVGSLQTLGSRRLRDAGDFEAGLDVDSLGSAGIAGDLAGATWRIAGDMGSLDVAGAIIGGQLILGGSAGGIKAAQWDGGRLEAFTAGSLSIRGGDGTAGDFHADVLLTGMGARGVSLGRLNVLGTVRDSCLRAAGTMSSLTMGAADRGDFLAGINPLMLRHADVKADFGNAQAAIGSVRVKGLQLARGEQPPRFVVDSNFSAASIGAVSLLNVQFDNGAKPFGLFALNQGGPGDPIASVRHQDTLTGESWNWPVRDEVFAQPDMVIQII